MEANLGRLEPMPVPQRILVRAPNWIGDQVMAIPFYRGLRAKYRDAQITLLAKPVVLGLDTGVRFEGKIALPQNAKALRECQFDLAITLPASFSSALLLRLARIPRRIGFAEPAARWLLTESLPWRGRGAGRHKSDLYLDLLRKLGGAPAKGHQETLGKLREKVLVLAPGASIRLREWPYFPELTRRLRERYPDYSVVVVGSEADRAWEKLTEHGAQSLIGKTSLGELRELCAKAAAVVANDSGVAHLAATLGEAPTVVLFGPGDPDYIRPQGARVFDARAQNVLCSPCESARCRAPYGYQKCLKDLPVEMVLEQVAEALAAR